MKDLLELYQTRASVRRFKPEPLREGDLDKILFAAQRAPTDATAQMYSLLRISDPELRKQVSGLSGSNPHIETCAEFFLILADIHRLQKLVEHRGGHWGHWPRTAAHFATGDAFLAGSALATMAEALGYGIVWIGGVLNGIHAIGALCQLPEGVFPVAGLCVGVPDETPAPRPRLARELVVHENHYQQPSPEQLERAFSDMAPIARGDWYKALERYFTTGGTMERREGSYQHFAAKQGFDPDLSAGLVRELEGKEIAVGSLGELIEGVFAQGFRSIQFHRDGHVWIETEPEAYRGDGKPGEALAKALLQAPKERIIPQ